MLKFKLDEETFSTLNEVEQTFYAKAGDGYQLQVDGATDKSKLDEFRATNVDLLKQQEQYKGVDLEKYRALEEQERKLRDKELIDKGEFDTLVAERTNSIKSDYEAKLSNANEQAQTLEQRYNSLLSETKIGGAANKAFVEHKIKPSLYEAAMLQVNSKFTIDNGQVIAKDGDSILSGADGNLTVSEYVASLGEDYRIPSSGGRATGSDGGSVMQQGQSSSDRIRAGLAKRMG